MPGQRCTKRCITSGCLAIAALAAAACAPVLDNEELYERMEQSALTRQWDDADRYARQYILRNPHDPAGHFYLGFRYLHSERPWFGVAMGQYRLALRLFEEGDRVNPIERFESAAVFEALCHLEISKVYQKQLLFLLDAEAPREAFGPLLDNWQAVVDIVRELEPDSEAVRVYDRLIRDFRSYIERLPPGGHNFHLETI